MEAKGKKQMENHVSCPNQRLVTLGKKFHPSIRPSLSVPAFLQDEEGTLTEDAALHHQKDLNTDPPVTHPPTAHPNDLIEMY